MYINGYLCGMWQVARELKKVTKKIGLNYIVCMYVGGDTQQDMSAKRIGKTCDKALNYFV